MKNAFEFNSLGENKLLPSIPENYSNVSLTIQRKCIKALICETIKAHLLSLIWLIRPKPADFSGFQIIMSHDQVSLPS